MPRKVSAPLLSARRNRDRVACWWKAGLQLPWQAASARTVPWLDGLSPTRSSTTSRVSGQKRSAQRGTIPPWLQPTTSTSRWDCRLMVRSAWTTYSPATWMSPVASNGSVIAHQRMPMAVKARW